WSQTGAREGEAVFVIGNPGTTSRLGTVSQLLYERDNEKPMEVQLFRSRSEAIAAYIAHDPALADSFDLRNTEHQLENERKRAEGELAGPRDDNLVARRRAPEGGLPAALQASASLRAEYGDVIRRIDELQRAKEASARQAAAFTYFASPITDAHVLIRAVYGYIYGLMRQRGAPESQLDEIRKEALGIEDWPAELEERMLAARLGELQTHLGPTDPTVNRILAGRTPEAAAAEIV